MCCRYRGIDEKNEVVCWFWEVLDSFSNEERIQFLRFVSGRTRLPANPSDISQRFQIMNSDRVSALNFLSATNLIYKRSSSITDKISYS